MLATDLSRKTQVELLLNNYDFSPLLCEAWGNAMVPNNIISGFRRSGYFHSILMLLTMVPIVAVMQMLVVHLQVTHLLELKSLRQSRLNGLRGIL